MVRIIIASVVGVALITGVIVVTVVVANVHSADDEAAGLVTARHSECDFGPKLLHYLRTGDNSGNPMFDTEYAGSVGESLPEARADVDKAIAECDSSVDSSVAAASETSREQAMSSEQAAANVPFERACEALGARYDPNFQNCVSLVPGNPSDRIGTSCSNSVVPFDGDTVDQQALAEARQNYPGCWPTN